jgi:hypothetical protein
MVLLGGTIIYTSSFSFYDHRDVIIYVYSIYVSFRSAAMCYMNFGSESDSDFYDDCNKEESDDEDDYSSAQIRTWRASYFTPRIFTFNSQSGINSDILDFESESPLEFFKMLFDQSVLEQIVNETNKYHSLSNTSVLGSSTSRFSHLEVT